MDQKRNLFVRILPGLLLCLLVISGGIYVAIFIRKTIGLHTIFTQAVTFALKYALRGELSCLAYD